MPYPHSAPPASSNTPRRWRRHHRSVWARRNGLMGTDAMLAAIPSLPRAELARLTDRLIDRMDEIDGDPDLEHLRDDDEDTHDREEEYRYE